jgi:hypothetical protein
MFDVTSQPLFDHLREKPPLIVIVGAGCEDIVPYNLECFLRPPADLKSQYSDPSSAAPAVPSSMDDKIGSTRLRHSRPLRESAELARERDAEDWVWEHYEAARLLGASLPPPAVLLVLGEIARRSYLPTVISLNYTAFIERALALPEGLHLRRNPVLTGHQVDPYGYFTNPGFAPAPGGQPVIDLFTIHGSLSFASFVDDHPEDQDGYSVDPRIFPLPPYLVGRDNISARGLIRQYLEDKREQLNRNYKEFPFQPYAPVFQRTPSSSAVTRVDKARDLKHLHHHIDWSFQGSRDRFQKEIDAAKSILERDKESTVLLLGFSCRYNDPDNPMQRPDHNEELDKSLRAIYEENPTRLWAIISAEQQERLRRAPGTTSKQLLYHMSLDHRAVVGVPNGDNDNEKLSAWKEIASALYDCYASSDGCSFQEFIESWHQRYSWAGPL